MKTFLILAMMLTPLAAMAEPFSALATLAAYASTIAPAAYAGYLYVAAITFGPFGGAIARRLRRAREGEAA